MRATSQGKRPQALVISLRQVDDDHAVIDAWLEDGDTTTELRRQHPVRCDVVRDLNHLNLDVYEGDSRIAAVTFAGDRLLYARTTLLTELPWSAGSWDPPTGELAPAPAARQLA